MPPAAGTKLGPYELLALVGAGGMGQVYRARDPRLGREVAVKVISSEGASDPARRERFEQEARAAAALNHPNILAVFDIGTSADGPYIVSELLEGETLRDRIARSRVTARLAIEIATQIARGLAVAHERGIVHRDIKPENVFLTKDDTAKILDFGLAKLHEQKGLLTPADGATVTAAPATSPGVVMGTVGYMSPEQVRGEAADQRSDIFALGCVLYELVSGQRAFSGPTSVETMHAVLTAEPAESPLNAASIRGGLERIIRRCLDKNASQRFQSARDLAFALEAVSDSRSGSAPSTTERAPAQSSFRMRELAAWTGMAALAIVAAYATLGPRTPEPKQVIRFSVSVPQHNDRGLASLLPRVAPDSSTIAFRAYTARGAQITLRALDSDVTTEVPTANQTTASGGGASEWSPDGHFLMIRNQGYLYKVDLRSGAGTPLMPYSPTTQGWSWGADNRVLVADGAKMRLLNAADGTSSEVPLTLPPDTRISSPAWLDRDRFLFTTLPNAESKLYLAALGSPDVKAVATGVSGRIVVANTDAVLFTTHNRLFAQRFDAATSTVLGEPALIASGVEPNSVSATDSVLTYTAVSNAPLQFTWYSRSGGALGTLGPPGRYPTFDLSPDGSKLVVVGPDQNLWLMTPKEFSRISLDTVQDFDPRWGPGGEISFATTGSPNRSPWIVRAGGTPAAWFTFPGIQFAQDDWSRDGKWLVYHDTPEPAVLVRPADLKGDAVVATKMLSGVVDQAQMSPDSKLIAFNNNQSGNHEVFVVPFPPTGARYQISRQGGVQATWRADGRELYFFDLQGNLMGVEVQPGSPPHFGEPRVLFNPGLGTPLLNTEEYAPSPDGQRFLMLMPVGNRVVPSFNVIVNWRDLMKAK